MTVPALVGRARAAAADLGFERSCRDEDGRLLHVLAGRRGIERVAEIGTGTGVGTAWLASALPPGVPLFSAEIDPRLAQARQAVLGRGDRQHAIVAFQNRRQCVAHALVVVDDEDGLQGGSHRAGSS